MPKTQGFSFHVARSDMSTFAFGTCTCGETVIRARVTKTQQDQRFNPQPTGGTEMDRVYSLHVCATARSDE
jgi:hypothetical protein